MCAFKAELIIIQSCYLHHRDNTKEVLYDTILINSFHSQGNHSAYVIDVVWVFQQTVQQEGLVC